MTGHFARTNSSSPPARGWPWLTDERSRQAVRTALLFADGLAGPDERSRDREAARLAFAEAEEAGRRVRAFHGREHGVRRAAQGAFWAAMDVLKGRRPRSGGQQARPNPPFPASPSATCAC